MIYIIGIGPGNSIDYLTVKAYKKLLNADIGIYVGEMIGDEIKDMFKYKILHVGNSISKNDVLGYIDYYSALNKKVVLMLPGDISLYSGQFGTQFCLNDYIQYIKKRNISYELIPGISSWVALNSLIGLDMTNFTGDQNVYITSIERLVDVNRFNQKHFETIISTNPNIILFQSYREWNDVKLIIRKYYPVKTKIIFAYKVSWEDEQIIETNIKEADKALLGKDISKHTLIYILPRYETVDEHK